LNLKFETPDDFFRAIPLDPVQNIVFRKELHQLLFKDEKLRKVYLEMSWVKPQILFNSAFFTYNPRKPIGLRNVPFILRPQQVEVIDIVKEAIDKGHNLVVNKNRDEGATELLCKLAMIYWLLSPETNILVGSRKEEYVDKATELVDGRLTGDHKCLFHKLLYTLYTLPKYLIPEFNKTHLQLHNLLNISAVKGESTNESFGAGDRATFVIVDELGRIEPTIAQSIVENINDVSDCCIFNSTHWNYGAAHPFNNLICEGKTKVAVLGWEFNPCKNVGLYRSSKRGIVEIKDISYFKQTWPGVFDSYKELEPININEIDWKGQKPYRLVADGGEGNFNSWRSCWFDKEEKRRSQRDIAQNILRIPAGSSDMFFDYALLAKIKNSWLKPPDIQGKVKYKLTEDCRIDKVTFETIASPNALKWWGKFERGRPDQSHNYIVACDIAVGTGASNSVMAVGDVNTKELVGLYVNPFIDIMNFAELVVATCKWVGGATKEAYLIWEAGGPGDTFDKCIYKLGYNFVYYQTDEKIPKRTKRHKHRGWRPTKGVNGTKFDLLLQLSGALQEGFKDKSKFESLKIHDEQLVNELQSYVFYEGRVDVGPVAAQLETSGAKFAHGDRVIAVGMIVLAMKYQPKAALTQNRSYGEGTFGHRMDERKRKVEEAKQNTRYLY